MDERSLGMLIATIVCGTITAVVAARKGRSPVIWFFFGVTIFIIALPAALLMKSTVQAASPAKGEKKCPACAEVIKAEARICKHCKTELATATNGKPSSARGAKAG